MNTSRKISSILLIPFFALHAGPLLADQFVVDNAGDPATGDPVACTGQTGQCTLRDALAAADLTAQTDSVIFDLDETIHLQKALVAQHPVSISGSGSTTIRVSQDYQVTLLDDDIPVLQPGYYSERGRDRAMLKLYGAGSLVENMVFDGSITPDPANLGVEYVDYESDDSGDYYLFTVNAGEKATQSRWPIAGAINSVGGATIRNSEFRYFDFSPITIDYSGFTSITDNVITGGAVGQENFNENGITMFASINSVISGNHISGYSQGVKIIYCSALEIRDNDFTGNSIGLELEYMGPDYGPVLVEGNNLSRNMDIGLYVFSSLGLQINSNIVNKNQSVGIHIKSAGEIDMLDNEVNHNGSGDKTHGGVLINEGSGLVSIAYSEASHNQGFGMVIDASDANVLSNNSMSSNYGAGLVLLGGTQWNNISGNELVGNYVGAITGDVTETQFPRNNTLSDNRLLNNSAIDAFDFDPDCNDNWVGNSIGTSFSVSTACLDQ